MNLKIQWYITHSYILNLLSYAFMFFAVSWYFFFVIPKKGTVENQRCMSVTPGYIWIWGALYPFSFFLSSRWSLPDARNLFITKLKMYVCQPFPRLGALANSPLYELIFLFYMPKMKHPRCQPSIWNVLKIFLINLKTCSKKSDFRWKCTFVTPCHVWGVFANSPINKIYFPFFYLQDEASTMPAIYLKCPKNIFDKFKNLFEKVWFSA